MRLKSFAPFLFLAAALASAQPLTVPWTGYGRNAQHTGLSPFAAQPLNRIKWQTPVDLVLANTPGDLLIHYGSSIVTAANTVIVPVRTSSSNTFRVDALNASDGSVKYSLATDYTPPPHHWIPSYGPALSARNRLYWAGAGGTVYYRDQPDSLSGPSGQIAFYGNALYAANQSAFNGKVMVSTPIVSDRYGDIFFGFIVTDTNNPAHLKSGIARISYSGAGSWVSATAAAGGDTSITQVPLNCAPALSNDHMTLYFAVNSGNFTPGYLASVASFTLAPNTPVRLKDPETGLDASIPDDSSAAPTVGPDDDVYFGVFESACCSNDDRGWLLHFDKTLTTSKIPGLFGWDATASIVPRSLVPSYQGTSSYLVFTKYNNYAGLGPGGNGHNRIAVLDPNQSMTDPITSATVMNEVITVLGVTPDPGNGAGAVREWCINSAAIDPVTKSAIANSEDGVVYRWDFTTNTLTQQLRLTAGVGEAYTPTVIGVDGTSYIINDAILFAVGQ